MILRKYFIYICKHFRLFLFCILIIPAVIMAVHQLSGGMEKDTDELYQLKKEINQLKSNQSDHIDNNKVLLFEKERRYEVRYRILREKYARQASMHNFDSLLNARIQTIGNN